MARDVLTVQSIGRSGLAVAYSIADLANGHSFDNAGHNVFLAARNFHGLGGTITIVTPSTPDGLVIADRVVTIPSLVQAAIADDGGVQTDETTEANEATIDDMTLLPAAPVVGDAYYFANDRVFNQFSLDVSTAGVGSWTITWEYWDGGAWEALANVTDDSSGFTGAGRLEISWEVSSDFAPTTVNGQGPFWFVRARLSAFVSLTTQPLGEQAWMPGEALIGPFPAAVYDTIDVDPDPDIDPAVFVDVSGTDGIELAAIKLPGASY